MKPKLFTKNFTLLILGQVFSLFGNFILRLALSMYVLELTGSAAAFAGVLSIAILPTILLSPLGGILADRTNRRNMMVALDALTGLLVLCAALLLREGNSLAVISALLVALSVLGAFETPTVQACIPSMLTGDGIVRGNAVVNQAAALSNLAAPALGGVLYAAFGLKPVMCASVACFFVTAFLECFIRLEHRRLPLRGGVLAVAGQDFRESMRYIFREQREILHMLLFTALSRFFVMGVTVVGLPYLVRNVLGFRAGAYGAAESALAVATVLGSIAAGLLTGKLKTRHLSLLLAALGLSLFPAGLAFLFPVGRAVKYAACLLSFCGVQMAASIFSIFAVSLIQQRTPNSLIGKVMAYTSAITLCVQPIGQMAYGFLFDRLGSAVSLVLLPTGLAACLAGVLSAGFFQKLDKRAAETAERPW